MCRYTKRHRVAPTHADATRVVHGWLGIEADLRLPPLILLSLLTLEPVDCPPDEYGYSAGV
jgi:hypothetical protein